MTNKKFIKAAIIGIVIGVVLGISEIYVNDYRFWVIMLPSTYVANLIFNND